jgi:hypothetical protein
MPRLAARCPNYHHHSISKKSDGLETNLAIGLNVILTLLIVPPFNAGRQPAGAVTLFKLTCFMNTVVNHVDGAQFDA